MEREIEREREFWSEEIRLLGLNWDRKPGGWTNTETSWSNLSLVRAGAELTELVASKGVDAAVGGGTDGVPQPRRNSLDLYPQQR